MDTVQLLSYGADCKKDGLRTAAEMEDLFKEKSETGFGINKAVFKLLGKNRYKEFCRGMETFLKPKKHADPKYLSEEFNPVDNAHGVTDAMIASQWNRKEFMFELTSWVG